MTFYGAIYWPSPETCLDEVFDAPDLAADAELCRGIAAGKLGLHPDAWGNHDPLPLRWLLRKRPPPASDYYDPTPAQWAADKAWEAKHRRRPVEESPIKPAKPKPKLDLPPAWHWMAERDRGTIELTCDECGEAFGRRLDYDRGRGGERAAMAAGLRALGKQSGWTHVDGRDRCPECSGAPAPEDVGDGAGERDHDKQHTNGG
jgi:hypothetical protein